MMDLLKTALLNRKVTVRMPSGLLKMGEVVEENRKIAVKLSDGFVFHIPMKQIGNLQRKGLVIY